MRLTIWAQRAGKLNGVRLLLIADTHVPERARDLPPAVWAEVAKADVVIHAGDWVHADLLNRLEARSRRLLACPGNNDGPEIWGRLPEVAEADLAGLRVSVIHETGGAKGREQRLDRRFPATKLLVFGHSHIPWDSTTANGMRLLNPGSPTDRRRQARATYLTLELAGGQVGEVTLHAVTERR